MLCSSYECSDVFLFVFYYMEKYLLQSVYSMCNLYTMSTFADQYEDNYRPVNTKRSKKLIITTSWDLNDPNISVLLGRTCLYLSVNINASPGNLTRIKKC